MKHAMTFGAIAGVAFLTTRLDATAPQTCESLVSQKAPTCGVQ